MSIVFEDIETVLTTKTKEYPRRYLKLRNENELDSNLTELNAATMVDAGFINHTDWSGHVMRYGYIAKELTSEQPSEVLDVGCGTLQLPYFLWKNRFAFPATYWGLDLRARQTWLLPETCKLKAPVTLVRGDVVLDDFSVCPGWPGEGFGVVVCTEVFEHVPRTVAPRLLQNLFEWTKPGGVCYLSTPNAGVSDSTADNHIDKATGESREWTFKDKRELCRKTGFVIEKSFGTFGRQDRYKPRLQAMPALIPDGKNEDGTPKYREGTMWDHPVVQNAKAYLNHSWFCTFIAATFPAVSNNAIFKLRKPR